MITLRFSDFWKKSESVQEKFFSPLISKVYEDSVEIIVDPEIKVDLEIFSVFPKKPTLAYRGLRKYGLISDPLVNPIESSVKANARRKIWFTGENIKPPIPDEFDAYLSYESNNYHSKNIYLPLWVLNINWFGYTGVHGFTSLNPTQEELLRPPAPNRIGLSDRSGCCAFIGVMENSRRNALYELRKIMATEIFGASVNNRVVDKIQAAEKYKFVLAFENSNSPGYVTEKLLEAHLTNAFPLYMGPLELDYFNSERFINLSSFSGLDGFISEVKRLDQNEDELIYRLSQPVMSEKFDFELVIKNLRDLLL